tara:strand:- start:2636 stop:3592 length:957 start_codon:yes stop_codon:yes gene_type:complete
MSKKLSNNQLMNFKSKFTIILYILIFLPSQVFALENKILFKINNEIISTMDVYNEIQYLKLLNDEFRKFEQNEIFKIAKDSLIRDRVKEIELKKFYQKIELDEKFIKKFAINYFSQLNINSYEDLKKLLKKNNLQIEDLVKKITIQLMWNEIVLKKFSKSIKIDKQLIKEEISKKSVQDEFLISEIVFNIKNKNELNKKFEGINAEIKKSNFSKAAIIHSISGSSVNGGQIGWVKESSFSKAIKNEIANIQIGEITKPIKIPGGFIILKIENIRKIRLELNDKEEIEKIIKRKTNEQLNQFSNIYFNKVKRNVRIDEL